MYAHFVNMFTEQGILYTTTLVCIIEGHLPEGVEDLGFLLLLKLV